LIQPNKIRRKHENISNVTLHGIVYCRDRW